MLARPDDLRGRRPRRGRRLSAIGRDRFDEDDETTLTIFAGWAAQAMVNAANLERLQRQQAELEHQLDGQRRLLDVNERLLLDLDLGGVLDLIADSLKAIVPYDSLTIYRWTGPPASAGRSSRATTSPT